MGRPRDAGSNPAKKAILPGCTHEAINHRGTEFAWARVDETDGMANRHTDNPVQKAILPGCRRTCASEASEMALEADRES